MLGCFDHFGVLVDLSWRHEKVLKDYKSNGVAVMRLQNEPLLAEVYGLFGGVFVGSS